MKGVENKINVKAGVERLHCEDIVWPLAQHWQSSAGVSWEDGNLEERGNPWGRLVVVVVVVEGGSEDGWREDIQQTGKSKEQYSTPGFVHLPFVVQYLQPVLFCLHKSFLMLYNSWFVHLDELKIIHYSPLHAERAVRLLPKWLANLPGRHCTPHHTWQGWGGIPVTSLEPSPGSGGLVWRRYQGQDRSTQENTNILGGVWT